MENRSAGILTVVALGSAMIILYLLAGITVAVAHPVPTEYWAAAAALSGALVGLLSPQPVTKGSLTRQAARLAATGPDGGSPPVTATTATPAEPRVPAAVGATRETFAGPAPAPPLVDVSERAPAGTERAEYTATTERMEALTRAAATAPSYDWRIIGLVVIAVATFIAGIWLALIVGDHVAGTAYDAAVSKASTALIALGSAAGGAAVGLLAPTPGQATGQPR